MTPQHPAAPETETDANGLTEAEREALGVAALGLGHAIHPRIEAAVERIVAERVRVVEGERERKVTENDQEFLMRTLTPHQWKVVAKCLRAEAAETTARAESAEAAHEAEKAAHERLRAGVEALADEWKAWGHITTSPGRPHRPVVEVAVDALTTLLGGGEAR